MRQMKDSGIEWIGEIPEGWEVIRYKHICQILTGFPFKSDCFSNYSGVPLIRIRDITSGAIETFYTGQFDKAYLIKKGTILIGMDGDFNIRLWDNEDALLNQRCCAIYENKKSIKKFLFYTLPFGLNQINKLKYATTVKHLSSNDILNLCAPFPPLSEQQRIADYLDAKCAHIDQCLELTRQSMEKLRAYKLSCITEAVTKGLDPDVPLKDSGVPWIGKICEHYEIIKIKYFTDIIRGKFSHRPRNDPRFYNGEYPFIQTGDIKISNKYITKYSQTLNDNGFNISRQFPSGTIVMAIAANVGDVAILDFDACFPDSVIGFTNLININKLFFYYTLITLKQVFIEKSTISTQLNLNIEIVNEVKIPYPPLPEQERIAAYLDKKCARIDALLEEKQALLDKLAEYKKSLIFECVTGKREVPSCWNR